MGKTVLRMGEIFTMQPVGNLAFRDLTIDCGDNYLTDLRTDEPAIIRLQRCKVIGFDMGAGGSVMLSARTVAFWAEDSMIEAGHGRAPGSGYIFRVDRGLLARLDGCSIKGAFSSVYEAGPQSTYVFSRCKFVDMRPSFQSSMAAPYDGVRFEDCAIEYESCAAEVASVLAPRRHPVDIVSSPERFAALFERRSAGPAIDATEWDGSEPLPPGTVLTFPQGVHSLSLTGPRLRTSVPKDLVVRGAGMDRTLVRLAREIGVLGTVDNLTFEDVTIDCNDNYFTDLRAGGPAVIHLKRCRLVGFDMGAGGSSMLAADAAAFWAEDSIIEAGYGRSPGSGNLFDVRGGLLARLDRCTICGPFRSVYYAWGDTTQVFLGCNFTDLPQRMRAQIEKAPGAVHFQSCTFGYSDERPRARSLEDINPEWVFEEE